MGSRDVDVFESSPFDEGMFCRDHAAPCVDHIVVEDAGTPTDISDDLEDLRLIVFTSCFMHDGEIRHQDIRELFCLFGSAGIGGYDDGVFQLLFPEVLREDRPGIEDVDGDREEALDLIGV